VDINIVPGGIQNDFERVGEESTHETRYERAEEFIAACRKLWTEPGPVDFDGDYYRLRDAYCAPQPGDARPRFYLGGASPRALGLSGRQADVHLSWIEPLEETAKRNVDVAAEFDRAGRTPELGLRTHLVVRDTEDEAWKAANELIIHADPAVKAQRLAAIVGTQMVGQQAQAREAVDHRVGPHLWNGLSEVRVNCGTAIVGTPDQAADTLYDYARLGFREFILSGFPHVEECRRVSEEVLPRLRDRIAA
jgi:alkanesulfonate monooxygenase